MTDFGYNAFLASGLSFVASLFNLPQHKAVEAFQIIPIPSPVLHIKLVCILKIDLEIIRSKFFEDLLLG